MSILTKARLTALTETTLGTRAFSETLNEAKQESKTFAATTIFLSHSHLDTVEVEKLVVLLSKLGIRVYIDWLDPSLPPFTTAETARTIKRKIKEYKKFILLATNNAIASKWCNWELGFGDAHKYIEHIALFPLSENSGSWDGNEYLRIYPRIEEGNIIANYRVINPDETSISLIEWLRH